MIELVEYFISLEGEGMSTGLPTWFIRFPGCNLNCEWCDTEKEKKIEIKEESLIEIINKTDIGRICFTGGEPLLNEEKLLTIMKGLHFNSFSVQTNGTIYPKHDETIEMIDEWSISPKLITSGSRRDDEIVKKLIFAVHEAGNFAELKFVFQCIEDLNDLVLFIQEHRDFLEMFLTPVILQPVWGVNCGRLIQDDVCEILRKFPEIHLRVMIQTHKVLGFR